MVPAPELFPVPKMVPKMVPITKMAPVPQFDSSDGFCRQCVSCF